MDAQGLHLITLASEVFGQATRRAGGVLGGCVQAIRLLGQGLAQQDHVVAGAFGREGCVVDIGPQGIQHLAGLLGGQCGRRDQGLGHIAGAPCLGGQTGALTYGVGQHYCEAGRRQRHQGVDGEAQRIQVRRAGAELIRGP